MRAANCLRQLYFFATPAQVPDILERRCLPPAPVGHTRRAVRVVWLADSAEPDVGRALSATSSADTAPAEGLVRFTVCVADAQHWEQWANKHHVRRRVRNEIEGASGGLSGRWWVVPRAIPAEQWLDVVDVDTNEIIWRDTPRG